MSKNPGRPFERTLFKKNQLSAKLIRFSLYWIQAMLTRECHLCRVHWNEFIWLHAMLVSGKGFVQASNSSYSLHCNHSARLFFPWIRKQSPNGSLTYLDIDLSLVMSSIFFRNDIKLVLHSPLKIVPISVR
jgi:hypothetical protein